MDISRLPEPTATLRTYCKNCNSYYDVPKDRIFSGGQISEYATRCPNCGWSRSIPFKEVHETFGNLKV